MKRTWENIKWIFEPDGSLRDIYVQDVSIREWEILIDHLNTNFTLTYSGENKINKKYALEYLLDTSREMESKSLTIHLGQLNINCHFFLVEEIEFDIDPKDVNSIREFEILENFMSSISEALQVQVTLTSENSPEFPLFKVDIRNKINKYLTENEAKEIIGPKNTISNQLSILRTKLEKTVFPNRFKNKLLESGTQLHKPTKKEQNLW
jgi:hypothetical protein